MNKILKLLFCLFLLVPTFNAEAKVGNGELIEKTYPLPSGAGTVKETETVPIASFIKLVKEMPLNTVQSAWVKYGIDLNEADENGFTPLMAAAGYNNLYPEVVTFMSINGVNYEAVENVSGLTALFFATAFNPNVRITEILIAGGADINKKNYDGATPLAYAAMVSKNPVNITILAENGADVNAQDNFGNTPFMLAAAYNNKNMLENLILAGAKIGLKNNKEENAFFLAAKHNTSLEVLYFLNNLKTENLKTENLNIAKKAKKAKKDKNKEGFTPFLAAAAYNQNPEVLEALKTMGFDEKATLEDGSNALIVALLFNKNEKVIEKLLKYNYNLNQTFKHETSPLMVAALNSNPEIAKILLLNGAEIDKKNNNGQTALMLATMGNSNEVIKIFLLAGASLKIKDNKGRTAIDIATELNPKALNVFNEFTGIKNNE